jgi:hypothetical protein
MFRMYVILFLDRDQSSFVRGVLQISVSRYPSTALAKQSSRFILYCTVTFCWTSIASGNGCTKRKGKAQTSRMWGMNTLTKNFITLTHTTPVTPIAMMSD